MLRFYPDSLEGRGFTAHFTNLELEKLVTLDFDDIADREYAPETTPEDFGRVQVVVVWIWKVRRNTNDPHPIADSHVVATGSTFAAQNLNSGILPKGSSCGLVRMLAAAST